MLGTVLRTRVVSLPGSARSITRFISALSVPSRAPPRSITRAFTSSQISREYGYGDRRGDSEGRSGESAYVQQPRPPKNPPSQTLWIGNLPFAAVSQQVADLFSDFGTVTSVRIGTSPTGESKGFAHVDVADVTMAEAIMKANAEAQFFLDGRGLFLDYAAAAAAPRINMPADTLHFSNYSGDEALLQEAFKEFEDVIQETRLMRNPQTNASSRYGFIKFATVEDATAALTKFQGKEIAYGEALQLAYGRARREQAPRFTGYGEDRGGYGSRGGRSSRGGREGYGGGRPREYNGRGPPRSYGGDRGEYRPRQDYGGRGGGGGDGSNGGRPRGDSGESEPY